MSRAEKLREKVRRSRAEENSRIAKLPKRFQGLYRCAADITICCGLLEIVQLYSEDYRAYFAPNTICEYSQTELEALGRSWRHAGLLASIARASLQQARGSEELIDMSIPRLATPEVVHWNGGVYGSHLEQSLGTLRLIIEKLPDETTHAVSEGMPPANSEAMLNYLADFAELLGDNDVSSFRTLSAHVAKEYQRATNTDPAFAVYGRGKSDPVRNVDALAGFTSVTRPAVELILKGFTINEVVARTGKSAVAVRRLKTRAKEKGLLDS